MSYLNKRSPAILDYDVICLIGEGSFGRVYKAKSRCTNEIVAYKVIGKGGRSASELLTLRRECEIQQYLHHPNIIRMLDSFETENEIVVVTEFAEKGLFDILGEEKILSEIEAQKIICDLVSALYYLHSHRVLHRDLKPQNVLLDKSGVAKLCDFGFARTVNTSSCVLTSIKGTPLYMAPELMGENSYDHNADLWSLGCIAYELAVGHPPFTTTSILQLVRMVRRDPIIWPDYLSDIFLSFLKGLLQKDPNHRLTWPHLLYHPFVHNKICILENNAAALAVMSYTSPHIVNRVTTNEERHYSPMVMMPSPSSNVSQATFNYNNVYRHSLAHTATNHISPTTQAQMCNQDYIKQCSCSPTVDRILKPDLCNNASFPTQSVEKKPIFYDQATLHINDEISNLNLDDNSSEDDDDTETINSSNSSSRSEFLDSGHGSIETENEEWLEFIKNNIKDVMNGDIEALSEKAFLTMITNPLKNLNVSFQVMDAIVKLLSLPFVIEGINNSDLEDIREVYINCEVISDLLYATKQVTVLNENSGNSGNEIGSGKLQCLENVFALLCNLVFSQNEFLQQFHESCVTLQMQETFRILLSLTNQRNTRIVADMLLIVLRLLKDLPSSVDLIDKLIFGKTTLGQSALDFHKFLISGNETICIRTCLLIILLAKTHRTSFVRICNIKLINDLYSLKNRSQSLSAVAAAAEIAVKGLNT